MKLWFGVLLLSTVGLMAGCSKVNQHNYEQLEVGLSFTSVQGLLGGPNECEDQLGTKSCVWGTDNRFIRGSFVADKLVLYSGEGFISS